MFLSLEGGLPRTYQGWDFNYPNTFKAFMWLTLPSFINFCFIIPSYLDLVFFGPIQIFPAQFSVVWNLNFYSTFFLSF